MPFKIKRKRPRRKRRRGGNTMAAPLVRVNWNRSRRVAQNLTRDCRWFKFVDTIATITAQGWLRYRMAPDFAPNIEQYIQFSKYGSLFEEYKIIKMSCTFIPAHVGSESLTTDSGGTLQPTFVRGNVVTWVDPQGDSTPVTAIQTVMGRPSARIHNPRRTVRLSLDRPPTGYPLWGKLSETGTVSTPDTWVGDLNMFGTGFTPPGVVATPVYYYVVSAYKVLFRSRQNN